jgi:tetratricopeptide (TPR) repeat protein
MKSSCAVWLLFAVSLAPVMLAGSQAPSSQAEELFAAKKWDEAAKAYEAVVNVEPKNGQAWYRLAMARYNLRKYSDAISAWEHAEALGFAAVTSRYNIAACYALAGEREKALDSLSQAAKAGFPGYKTLRSDDDFKSLRDDSRFQQIAEQVKRTALPCEFEPRYQQFDFWVGDWDVYNPAGRLVGTNTIQKIAGGCALLENWESVTGGTGKSLNFFDASKGKWVQNWADSSGEVIRKEGEFADGAMRMEGRLIHHDGSVSAYRATWTPLPDGRVRQFLEESTDGGKTWNIWFDGYYKRKDAPHQ